MSVPPTVYFTSNYWFPAIGKREDVLETVEELRQFSLAQNVRGTAHAVLGFLLSDSYPDHLTDVPILMTALYETKPELVERLKAYKFENDLFG